MKFWELSYEVSIHSESTRTADRHPNRFFCDKNNRDLSNKKIDKTSSTVKKNSRFKQILISCEYMNQGILTEILQNNDLLRIKVQSGNFSNF